MCNDLKNPKVPCKVVYNKEIAKGIFEILLDAECIAKETKAGQFVNLYTGNETLLLPRPISICEVDRELGTVKLVYAVVGKGTKLFSKLDSGDSVAVLGPVGNGFPIKESKKTILVGGGVGTPPMLQLAKEIVGGKEIYLGFRSEPYLVKEFSKYGHVFVATDDGSFGHHGNVIELMNKKNTSGDVIYGCGPMPMLKGLKEYARDHEIECYLSLEERMGCGFGACVGCATKIVADNEVGYTYKKVCKDGPVFNAKEVLL